MAPDRRFHLLIVDDEPVNLQVLINHLSLQDYVVTQASSGLEALQVIDQGFRPDLILLDVMMPHMTGYEVTQKLRETHPANELPILMLTAKNQIEALVRGLDSGANDYLSKPIAKNELLARIKTHLQLAHINAAYGRFVPHQFLRLLDKESIIDVELGDQVEREMSVLFSDIRNFTGLSEAMTPAETFQFINSFFGRLEPEILAHQGFIDKFIGDGIMALFSGTADDALQAGIMMLRQVAAYNQLPRSKQHADVRVGIGINTGQVTLGTVGGRYGQPGGTGRRADEVLWGGDADYP